MSYRSSAQGNLGTSSSVVSKPTGTVDNDILLAQVVAAVGAAISAPADWSALGSEQVLGVVRVAFFWKRALNEGANYTFSSTGATGTAAQVYCFSGRTRIGVPTDGLTVTTTASGTVHTATGFTTTSHGDDLVYLVGSLVDNTCTYSNWGNLTERLDANTQGGATQDNIDQGPTGNISTTSSATTQCGVCLVALLPDTFMSIQGRWRAQAITDPQPG